MLRICCALAMSAGLAAEDVAAGPLLSKPQYIARADAVCARAIAQTHALGVVPSLHAWAGPAGSRLLSIDHSALAGLEALTPPPADAATLRRLLAGAGATVAETARALGAARAGDSSAFRTDAATVAVLTRRYQAGARAYGFLVCAHWGS